jgi:hypothetical protein
MNSSNNYCGVVDESIAGAGALLFPGEKGKFTALDRKPGGTGRVFVFSPGKRKVPCHSPN